MTKKKKITGYKMFKVDADGRWYCDGGDERFYYEVGKTYKTDEAPECCSSGFHFCKKLEDCFKYHGCVTWNKIALVEAVGEIDESEDDSKCATNKIKILEEIPFNEIAQIRSNSKNHSNGVSYSNGMSYSNGVSCSNSVNCSYGVNHSYGVSYSNGVSCSNSVNCSDGVNHSNGVSYSNGVNRSDGVSCSDGVSWSYGVNHSYGVNRSDGVNGSYGVNRSDGVSCSHGVNGSYGVNWSYGVNRSYGVSWSYGVNWSYGVLNCCGVDNALFLANKPRTFSIFGKEVTEERFNEVYGRLQRALNGWTPTFNNLRGLYRKFGNDWKLVPIPEAAEISKEEAWKDMPKEAIEYVASLPEFDAAMFKEITGIEAGND